MESPDVKQTIALNLQTLLDYARDHPNDKCGHYRDAKALAQRVGLTPSTIGRWLKAANAPQVDLLDSVAKVYGLRAWQLLIPNLDPSNPPAVPYTDTERALYWRIKSVAREFARSSGMDLEDDYPAGSGPAASPDPDRPQQVDVPPHHTDDTRK